MRPNQVADRIRCVLVKRRSSLTRGSTDAAAYPTPASARRSEPGSLTNDFGVGDVPDGQRIGSHDDGRAVDSSGQERAAREQVRSEGSVRCRLFRTRSEPGRGEAERRPWRARRRQSGRGVAFRERRASGRRVRRRARTQKYEGCRARSRGASAKSVNRDRGPNQPVSTRRYRRV